MKKEKKNVSLGLLSVSVKFQSNLIFWKMMFWDILFLPRGMHVTVDADAAAAAMVVFVVVAVVLPLELGGSPIDL